MGSLAIRGGVWNTLGRVVPQLYTVATSIVVARVLGASGVGRLSYIAFIEATLIVACTLGLPVSLMRHVGETVGRRQSGELRSLMRWAWRVETGGALIGFLTMAAIGLSGAKPESAWVFAGVACAGAILHNVPSALLIGTQRWWQATVVGLATGSVAVAAKVIALEVGQGIAALFLIDAIVAVLTLAGTSYYARRALAGLSVVEARDGELQKRATRFAAVQSIGVIVTFIVWRRTEVIFLNHYSSNRQIALYSIPFSVVSALLLLPAAISATMTPAIATLFGAGAIERIRAGYSRSMRLIVTLTLPLTAISMAVGPALVALVYGHQFNGARPVLLILLGAFPIVPLLYASSALLVGLGRQRVPIVVGAVAAVANILLDLALIPAYSAIGAAVANSLAQILGSLPIVVYAGRLVERTDWAVGALARTAVASAAGAGASLLALWLLGPIAGVVVAVGAFVIVFAGLAAVLRILRPDDALWLEANVGRRLGGFLGVIFRFASLRVQTEP
jgi:O-antigen/teichoic acid export membrane protein